MDNLYLTIYVIFTHLFAVISSLFDGANLSEINCYLVLQMISDNCTMYQDSSYPTINVSVIFGGLLLLLNC